jgi:hypothetical protein
MIYFTCAEPFCHHVGAATRALPTLPGVKVRMYPYVPEASGKLVNLVRAAPATVLRAGVTKTTGEMKDGARRTSLVCVRRAQEARLQSLAPTRPMRLP